jgi:hypothetical protein
MVEPTQPSTTLAQHTPSWLSIGGAYRFRFEGRQGNGYVEGNDESYGLGRLLVNIGIKPKPWLNFYFQGQDSRAPGKENATPFFRDPFDLRQAFVVVGEPEKGWATFKGGRQDINYGTQRLVGALDWGNTARQFDAGKLTLGKKDMSVDIFAASLVRIDPNAFNKSGHGDNLHGIYGKLNKLMSKTTFEPYLLWKQHNTVIGEIPLAGDADIFTGGFRWVRPLPGGFDGAMEVVRQFGTFANDDVSAWAGYWILGYTPPGWALSPRFSGEFAYATGDKDPNDGKRQTFDQLYPTAHLYHGIADRVGWRNIKDVRAGASIQPHRKVKVAADFFSFWLANRNDGLYGASGRLSVPAPVGGALSSHVGWEFDVTTIYKPKPHITVGGGIGHLIPGDFLKQNTPGASHTFPYVFLNYVL